MKEIHIDYLDEDALAEEKQLRNEEIEHQAIKTLTATGWLQLESSYNYEFEKLNSRIIVKDGHIIQLATLPLYANELDVLAALCRLTERTEQCI